MIGRLLFLLTAVAINGCGSKTKSRSEPATTPPAKPPSFSAWNCPEAGHQDLFLAEEGVAVIPRWMRNLSTQEHRSGIERNLSMFSATSTTKHATLRYSYRGVPLCRIYGRADEIDGQRFVHDPSTNFTIDKNSSADDWLDSDESAAAVARALKIEETLERVEATKCFWDDGNHLVAAWEIHAQSPSGPVHGFANGSQSFAFGRQSFDVDGSARIYNGNVNGALVDIPLQSLDETGVLSSKRFMTILPQTYTAATSIDGRFLSEPTDSTFDEISLFANAELMSQWFDQFEQHQSFGCLPIEIHPHTRFGSRPLNNAFYKPNAGDGRPGIFVGDGDGIGLKNLATDMEAVSHEVGHHVVYRTVKDDTDEESVIIHEGLADFFVYARTGNPCLGETLCPASSSICWKPGQCLRTARNSLKFTDANLPAESHKKSQMLSGMLWDLSQDLGFALTTPLVLKSVDYLLPRSTYKDLVIALVLADQELNHGQNACSIVARALDRGFESRLGTNDCVEFASHLSR